MLDKMPKRNSQKLDRLVKEYEEEECVFTEENCLKFLILYLDRMEDCHFKATLYKHLCYLEDRGLWGFTEDESDSTWIPSQIEDEIKEWE